MRLMRLQSIVCRLVRRQSGYLRRRVGHPLRHPTPASRTDRPPTREDWVHSLVSASPLRSLSAAPSGRLFRVGTTLPGFRPSPRHLRWCPLSRELPPPATFRPRVFSTPRRITPPFGFAGLLHPAATQGFFRSGASPDPQRSPARRRALPPCRYRLSTRRSPGCRVQTPRLRGLAPRIDAFLRVDG